MCGQLISKKGGKTIQWGKEKSLEQMLLRQLDTYVQKMKLIKNEVELPLYNVRYKNQLRVVQIPQCKSLRLQNS